MREQDQIPRNSLAWLLFAQVIVLLPHASHLPLWLSLIWAVTALWRWQIFRGAWNFPGLWVRGLLVVMCAGALVLVYRGNFGTETMVSLLIVGFVLKLLELKTRRDLLLLCYLGYFVAATQFLFFSHLPAALYGLFSISVVTASLLACHQSLQQYRFWRSFRLTSVLMLQALPLMLILFLFVPRVGSLWSVPMNNSGGISGISDSMSPGDLAQLMQSRELAFRVSFEGDIPPSAQLYWRGLVFSQFDGRTWTQSARQSLPAFVDWHERSSWRDNLEDLGNHVSYRIMLEPTRQRWLFSLSAPVSWDEGIGIGREFRLQRQEPVRQRMQYQVTSVLDYRYDVAELEEWHQRQELSLPADSNPQTRRMAERWMDELDGSAEALIERLLNLYRGDFRYTLQPGVLGRHPVDEFLWQTRAGFCEHFASSFVFFLRAAGVPARVVVGYQGGERNPLEDYLLVRQQDAHAWAEVWLEGQGWVSIDPTAAVAPERIESGLQSSLDELDSRMLDRPFGNSAWLNQMRLRWDLFNYNWNRWVMGYQAEQQRGLLQRWLGGVEPWRIVLAILLPAALFLSLLLGIFLWRQRPRYRYPEEAYLALLNRKLARRGLAREPGETVRDWVERVGQAQPGLRGPLQHIATLYEQVSYGERRHYLQSLKRAVLGFRLADS